VRRATALAVGSTHNPCPAVPPRLGHSRISRTENERRLNRATLPDVDVGGVQPADRESYAAQTSHLLSAELATRAFPRSPRASARSGTLRRARLRRYPNLRIASNPCHPSLLTRKTFSVIGKGTRFWATGSRQGRLSDGVVPVFPTMQRPSEMRVSQRRVRLRHDLTRQTLPPGLAGRITMTLAGTKVALSPAAWPSSQKRPQCRL
jgi:hypothetical protein